MPLVRVAVQPQRLSRVLGVVIRALSGALLKQAGVHHCDGACTGMVTFIQRFSSNLNLTVHLHVLALDGVYSFEHGKARFHRAGVLVSEHEYPYLDLAMDSPDEQLAGAAIRYVIAAGPQAGRATLRLHGRLLAVGGSGARSKPFTDALDGCSLNCAVACEVNGRAKLERVWRYMARGRIGQERLSVDGDGLVVLELKRATEARIRC